MSPPREGLKLPAWAVPIVIAALFALGAARITVGGKEDASAHAADISEARAERTAVKVELQGEIRDLRSDFEKKTIRDSAANADAMRILLDIQKKVNR